jgi:hypothetical protein
MNELNEVISKLLTKNLDPDLYNRIVNLEKSLTDENLEEIFNEVMKILDEIENENKLNNKRFLSTTGSLLLSVGLSCQYLYPEFVEINIWYSLIGLSMLTLNLIL